MKQAGLTGVTFSGDDGTFGQDFSTAPPQMAKALLHLPHPARKHGRQPIDAAYLAAYGQPGRQASPPIPGPVTTPWLVLVKAIESVASLDMWQLYIPRAALVAAVRATSNYQACRHHHL